MTLRKILLAGTALGAAALLTGPAFAGSAAVTQNEINTLKQQMEDLQQKLDDLQVSTQAQLKTVKTAPASDAFVTMKGGHPTIASNDGNFTLSFNGRAHFDVATASTDDGLKKYNDGANFRRAEIGVSGTAYKDWGYAFAVQFGGSGKDGKNAPADIKEGYISYNGIKDVSIQAGAICLPFTLDYATSSNDITLIERAAAVSMMVGQASDDGRTAFGVKGHTDNIFAMAYYTKDRPGQDATTHSESDNWLGRAVFAFNPDANSVVHIGGDVAYSSHFSSDPSLGDRPGIRVDDIKYINTGSIANVDSATFYGPEAAVAYGPFRAQGEYYKYDFSRKNSLSDLSMDAWYLQASWIITGEAYKYKIGDAAFGGVKPSHPIGAGGFGAWEIAARYSDADLNDGAILGGHEKLTTVGLNWYPNSTFRFMLNYMHGEETPNSSGTVSKDGNVDIVALRTQFAF
ncbi:hypothetical protein F2P47_00615 [Parvibaculum sedimenti]|uniref:Porin n=1 Tax=Parvibaculum sedimenti TaxID=2608632 RepID=A0A6N6VMB0_9HYPH|nr:porin [Parvibaculum sedimenti]KAB7742671.1 hypothetical protein F2P47_00615 [Parvibaculum sedimenti]